LVDFDRIGVEPEIPGEGKEPELEVGKRQMGVDDGVGGFGPFQ